MTKRHRDSSSDESFGLSARGRYWWPLSRVCKNLLVENEAMDFESRLREITKFFQEEGIVCTLVGAFALRAYGLARATNDLDFMTASSARDRTVAFMEDLGYETLHVSTGYSNHLHPDSSYGRVDFVYADAETLEKIRAASETAVRIGDVDVPVPSAEHLIAMKILAMKNDPTRSLQEMADIQHLLGVSGVDRDRVQEYFEKWGLLDRYDEIQKLS